MSATERIEKSSGIADLPALVHALALALVAIGALSKFMSGAENWAASSAYLLFFVHAGFSIARGGFSGAVSVTWVMLMIVFMLAEGLSIANYVMPVGQFEFLLASSPVGVYVERLLSNLAFMGLNLTTIGLLAFILFIGINAGTRFTIDDDGDGMFERLLAIGAVVLIAILVIVDVLGNVAPTATTTATLAPEWYSLPYLAVLRALPTEPVGAAVTLVFMFLPVLAIFITRSRKRANRLFFGILNACALLAFVGLSWLGMQEVNAETLLHRRILMAIFAAYFVLGTFFTPRKKNAA